MKKETLFILLLIGAICILFHLYVPASAEKYVRRINQSVRENDIEKAFALLDEAAVKYPQRLDIQFGKIFLCQLTHDILCMQEGIKSVLEQSTRPGNVWLWENNETVGIPFMLDTIQTYQKFFFENEYDDALSDTAHMILKAYPDHFESLNGLGILAVINNDCAAAKKYLDKARKLAPTDILIKKNYSQYLKRCPSENILMLKESVSTFK